MTCVCRTGAFGSDSCSLIHSCIIVSGHPSWVSPARSRSNQPRNPGTTYAYGTHCKYSPAFFSPFGPSPVTRHLMWAIHLNTRGGRQTIARTQRGHKQHLRGGQHPVVLPPVTTSRRSITLFEAIFTISVHENCNIFMVCHDVTFNLKGSERQGNPHNSAGCCAGHGYWLKWKYCHLVENIRILRSKERPVQGYNSF